ncbi:MAG TPA: mandelate racemase/muconate lactonizing enzyme family protein [Fodinibius sp.]|nr:mandelate racemase/muconate lactonizing enzyme family protein [Fodinibius sp.]
MNLRITETNANFEREPLVRPFGFKGGYMNEIWQSTVLLETADGDYGWGLGCQNILWCDPRVFGTTSESGANSLMFSVTERALQMVRSIEFTTPVDLIKQIFDELYEYAKEITGISDLKKTFVLNALVPVDNAAWMLYARVHEMEDFDNMIPSEYRPGLSYRHDRVASIPISSYGMPMEEIRALIEKEGYFILKLKLGAPGSQQEMLEKDKARLEQIHQAIGDKEVLYTDNGKLPYYFDANGRYQSKQTLQKLLDHARRIGAFDQILLIEEPFPEEYKVDVGDLGVRVAADESAHTPGNVRERIDMGYGAMALKPVAKTLSMTLRMAREAYEQEIPCFCADLTVNPILVDWNKNVAARLSPLPGVDIGLLETNGHQNYKHWNKMEQYHSLPDASWTQSTNGVFPLNKDFYKCSGGIFKNSQHYLSLVE